MTHVEVRPYGPEAVLVDLAGAHEVATLRAAFAEKPPVGAVETMPGLRTVLVRFDACVTDAATIAGAVLAVDLTAAPPTPTSTSDVTTVRVRYDGADLAEVVDLTGMTAPDVIAAHQAPTYRVVLIGMAPGFYFLAGGDPRLVVPRRRTPRTDVPKGAIGLAGDLTGVYPRLGPGGWQLIGTVVDDLWHPTDLPAARLAPGAQVRFAAGAAR